jgi:hypothetical protein
MGDDPTIDLVIALLYELVVCLSDLIVMDLLSFLLDTLLNGFKHVEQ